MENVKIKFDWGRIDGKYIGHSPNEWGQENTQKNLSAIQILAYKVKWES